MKKLLLLCSLILTFSCSNSTDVIGEVTEIVPKNIEIILTTNKLEFDEIIISNYNFDEEKWDFGPQQFTYDSEGNPKPIILSFPNYQYKYIEGEAYRKNNLNSSLKVEIYINDVLMFEKESIGTDTEYAHVVFNYTIE